MGVFGGGGAGVCVWMFCLRGFMKQHFHPFGVAPMSHPTQLLGLGTSKGKLHVFDLSSSEVCAVAQFTAHMAHSGEQDPLFGQLGKQ